MSNLECIILIISMTILMCIMMKISIGVVCKLSSEKDDLNKQLRISKHKEQELEYKCLELEEELQIKNEIGNYI
jgi:cell division protein FtsB